MNSFATKMLLKQLATLALCLLGAVKAFQEVDSNSYFNHPSTNNVSNRHVTPLRQALFSLQLGTPVHSLGLNF